ncbi:hypothetical protein FSP39_020782 [Pinctada imbricata]|uniref:Phospholipase B1, membrane-associated n=1 Tax=Pinctada imbricata TaxID=66713 RepID=A0AA89BZV0_PINIB|nr:hypothetical protein FSP39_020782 [Pinctada imbricata]
MKAICGLIFLGIICSNLAARATFADYEAFLRSQMNNATFVDLFNKHVKLFEDKDGLKLPTFPCKKYIRGGPVSDMIKMYNPDVKGFAVGSGNQYSKNAHLNVADSGAVSVDLIDQARHLVDLMKKEPGVDFENDWKIITLFIGGNDLCDYCDEELKYSVANYKANIQETLDILHKEVPRAFVNVVEVLNIADINVLNEGLVCDTLHFFTCRCGAFPSSAEREAMDKAVKEYQHAVVELVNTGRYDTRDDFTVVVQPFYENTQIPRVADGGPDLSYFAPDCFHLSAKGHKAAAEALWDNMIEVVGEKRTRWTPTQPVECPSADNPYFSTNLNSRTRNMLNNDDIFDDDDDDNNDDGADDNQKQNSSTATPGVVITVSGLVLGLFIVAIVVYVIRKRRSSEREKLLGHTVQMSYTQI